MSQDEITECLEKHVNQIKEYNRKQWTKTFSILAVFVVALLSLGAVQMRVSTRNTVLINKFLEDERMAVDYKTWYQYNVVTKLQQRALAAFLNGNAQEFLAIMDEFEVLKSQITETYLERQKDRYRGLFKPDNEH